MLLFRSTAVFAMQNPDPVVFSAFGLSFYWYGVLMAAGVILAFLLVNAEVKRRKLHPDTAFDLCIICVPLGVIFARAYYVLFNFEAYRSNPIGMLYIWEGGLAIYGAIIGGLLGLILYARIKKIRLLTLLDICAPGLALAQAIGRWGNFFNQEAYGILVTNPNHMWFPLSVLIDRSNTIHYATFFYESVWCLLIFLLLWFRLRKRAKHTGDMFFTYAFLYAFERMLVEQLRTDSLYWGRIRVSQLISAILFVGIGTFFIVRAIRERKVGHSVWPTMPEESQADSTEAEEAEERKEAEEASGQETDNAASAAAQAEEPAAETADEEDSSKPNNDKSAFMQD